MIRNQGPDINGKPDNSWHISVRFRFFPDDWTVDYKHDDIPELDLAYAITIHKSQGSECGTVIIPVLIRHFKMLFLNLIYTALTQAKNRAVIVGTRKALATAVKNQDTSQRQPFLEKLLGSKSVV